MIKIEKTEVVGLEPAIRGMRNPRNSWDKSDSHHGLKGDEWDVDPGYIVGPADHGLMMKLSRGGSVHAKYRRYIDVYVDITAPLYWWKELDTYRTVVSPNPFDIEMDSCSTMYTITEKEFEEDDFSNEHLLLGPRNHLTETVALLNFWRTEYFKADKAKDEARKKECWWQIIQTLPTSYNQKRTLKLNYETLAAMYEFRKNHKQDEWKELCAWVRTLPYSDIITLENPESTIKTPNEQREEQGLPRIKDIVPVEYHLKCNVLKGDIPDNRRWIERGKNMRLMFQNESIGTLVSAEPFRLSSGTEALLLDFKIRPDFNGASEIQELFSLGYFDYGFTVSEIDCMIYMMLYKK